MIRSFVDRLSRSALFLNVSTAFAFLAGLTSLAALVGFILWCFGVSKGFEVNLGVELTMARLGDRIYLLILTLFFGVLSLGVLARDRHIRTPTVHPRN